MKIKKQKKKRQQERKYEEGPAHRRQVHVHAQSLRAAETPPRVSMDLVEGRSRARGRSHSNESKRGPRKTEAKEKNQKASVDMHTCLGYLRAAEARVSPVAAVIPSRPVPFRAPHKRKPMMKTRQLQGRDKQEAREGRAHAIPPRSRKGKGWSTRAREPSPVRVPIPSRPLGGSCPKDGSQRQRNKKLASTTKGAYIDDTFARLKHYTTSVQAS
ncbi:hypothetical protein C8R45DRAFT_933018 [Mycena sanguinolenta]|nr:hypothetical protein C8R45DRAFT_933018 [Mycena sanguinolenta]